MELTNSQIYKIILLSCILINMDHGVIPACTFELKNDLKMNDFFLGLLGSLVFGGLMLGSLIR